MAELLSVVRHDAVCEMTLNRPDKGNALGPALVDALAAGVAACEGDGTRLLVLRGAGRHFCAGFDFSDLDSQSDAELALRFIRIEALLQAIFHAPFHTLALVQGRALGAGADLVCACDSRIAAPGSHFAMPGPTFGIVLGTGRLAHRIGWPEAAAILLQARSLDEREALALRFLSAVAEPADWPAAVAGLRDDLAKVPAATAARMRARLTPDSRAADMASLVESVRQPGLADRLRAYYDAVRARPRSGPV